MSEQETTVRERVMRWLSTPGVGILLAAIITSWFALTQVANFNASDVLEYEQYAHAFWFDNPPFRALPVEYPPLALAPFTLTLFPAGAGPFVAFGLRMVDLAVLIYLMLVQGWSRRAAISFGVYLLLGAVSVALSRDLVPVAFTVAAWLAAERKRFTLAYALAGGWRSAGAPSPLPPSPRSQSLTGAPFNRLKMETRRRPV